jgi:putative colanic acid biosynthesis UDP-glucose lipid carrier transferase
MYMRVRYDLDYLENWSLWWDLEIILRTVGAVLSRRNAL